MEKRGERMEITLNGGKPWGFSIKGGTESTKWITVSKLEQSGKGEASGLRIGDRILSVNYVVLGGIRKEAVELIRGAGKGLTLEVERDFSHQRNAGPVPKSRTLSPQFDNSQPGSRKPLLCQFQDDDQSRYSINNSENFNTNYSNNQPRGYVFAENNDRLGRKQIQEILKSEFVEKKNIEHHRRSMEIPLTQEEIDLEHDRRFSLGRKNAGLSSPMHNETHPVPPPRSVAQRRQGNKSSAARPRSWHASKHPETETVEIRSTPLSSTEKINLQIVTKRRSKGWTESEDLKSTLHGDSTESLTTRERFSESGKRRSGNSENAFRGSCPDTMNYEEIQHNDTNRLSYNSSNNNYELLSLSTSSRNIDHESSSGSNSSGNIEGSIGNRLRSSGRYGEIWKLPQQVAHRRAKSFDALSEDPAEQRSQNIGNQAKVLRKSTGHSSAADVTLYKYENSSKKSSSPTKSSSSSINNDYNKKEQFRSSRHFVVEKGELSDASSSSFDRLSSSGGENTASVPKMNFNKYSNQNENIVVRLLRNSHTTSNLAGGTRRLHHSVTDQPTELRLHAASNSASKPLMRSSVSALDDFEDQNTESGAIMSNNDEYKKHIQGMSKKVLRVTSFTRKDLELSPPYQTSPLHTIKGFGFPVSAVEKNLFSNNGFAAVRSKSTSSLLDSTSTSTVSIPITHEQANLMQGKQYCESLPFSQPTCSTVENSRKEAPCESTLNERNSGNGRRFRGSKQNSLTDVPELRVEETEIETSHKNYLPNKDSPSRGVLQSARIYEAELKPPENNMLSVGAEARPKSASNRASHSRSPPMTRPKSATNKSTFSPKLQHKDISLVSNVWKKQPYLSAPQTQSTTQPAMTSRVKAAANLFESSLQVDTSRKEVVTVPRVSHASSAVTGNAESRLRPTRTSLSPQNVKDDPIHYEADTSTLTHVLSLKRQTSPKPSEIKPIVSQNVMTTVEVSKVQERLSGEFSMFFQQTSPSAETHLLKAPRTRSDSQSSVSKSPTSSITEVPCGKQQQEPISPTTQSLSPALGNPRNNSITSSVFLPDEEPDAIALEYTLKTQSPPPAISPNTVTEPEAVTTKPEITELPTTVATTTKDDAPHTRAIISTAWSLENSSVFNSPTTTLPASSSYYQTSASKARIINLVQEKVEEGNIVGSDTEDTEDERNNEKVALLTSIAKKLAALQRSKDSIKMDINENEQLGKVVKQHAEKLCTPREHEKFKTFVEEIDKIFNLILSIAGRLARVDNALTTLGPDADIEEKNGLQEKKMKLTLQHEEAQSLKENVDRRQTMVSEILASNMDADQYADFEHYIKMKIALISEQRELDDKMKLGEEQLRELYDSLPESLQENLPLSSIPNLCSGEILGTT